MTEPVAAAASPSTTTFSVLGPITVRREGDVVPLGGPRQVAVLGRLLLAVGESVSMEQLIEAVWDGDVPARPEVTVRSYVSNLRRLIEPGRNATPRRSSCIESVSPGYRLTIDPLAVDANRFEATVAAGREALTRERTGDAVRLLGEALDLWRGDPFESMADADAVEAARSRLEELRLVAVEALAEALLRRGEHDMIMARLEPLLVQHPLRERLVELAMLALYRAGRQSESLALCGELRERLVERLGIHPGPAVQELEGKILRQDASLLHQADSVAGAATAVFADRDVAGSSRIVDRVEHAQAHSSVLTAVEGGRGGVVVITGEPGSGKSTLIASLLQRCAGEVNVVVGRCRPLLAGQAFWPWVQVAEALVSTAESGSEKAVVGDVEASVAARTLAVLGLLQRQNTVPLVVVLEDLHLADLETVETLAHAAEELADRPIVFVATWRDTEPIEGRHRGALRRLARLQGLTRIELGGLAPDAVADLAASTGHDVGPVADLLWDFTAGNPFFVVELAGTAGLDGDLVPTTNIREAVTDRVERLHPQASELLVTAALMGDVFSGEVLARALDLPLSLVDDVLERAVDGGILSTQPLGPAGYRFAHPVARAVLVDEVSAPRRVRLHAAIGHAMWRLGGEPMETAGQLQRAATAGTDVVAAQLALDAVADSFDASVLAEAARIIEACLASMSETPAASDLEQRCRAFLAQWTRVQGSGSAQSVHNGLAVGTLDLLGQTPDPPHGSELAAQRLGRAGTEVQRPSNQPEVVLFEHPARGTADTRNALGALAFGDRLARRAALDGLTLGRARTPLRRHLAIRLQLLDALARAERPEVERLMASAAALDEAPNSLLQLQTMLVLAGTQIHLGSSDGAAAWLARADTFLERLDLRPPAVSAALRAQLAWLESAAGRDLGLWVGSEPLLATGEVGRSSELTVGGVAAVAAQVVAGPAQAQISSGDRSPDHWQEVLVELQRQTQDLVTGWGGVVIHGPTAYYAGCAAVLAGEHRTASICFDEAAAHGRRLGAPSVVARALLRHAELSAAGGAEHRAARLRSEARHWLTPSADKPAGPDSRQASMMIQSFPNNGAPWWLDGLGQKHPAAAEGSP